MRAFCLPGGPRARRGSLRPPVSGGCAVRALRVRAPARTPAAGELPLSRLTAIESYPRYTHSHTLHNTLIFCQHLHILQVGTNPFAHL